VNTLFDRHSLNLSIGLISIQSQSVWSLFVNRLGEINWIHVPSYGDEENKLRLMELLASGRPDVIFLDERIRLKPNSPVWRTPNLKLVMGIEIWKGSPPRNNWACGTHTFSHQHLGGVTNGDFRVYWARRCSTTHEITFPDQAASRASLSHILDVVAAGSRCPIPPEGGTPLGQDRNGSLHWGRRLHAIEAPTVFSKTHWVKRKLTLKELCAVLDLPINKATEPDAKDWIAEITVPGKVRARVVDAVRTWFAPSVNAIKRSGVPLTTKAPVKKPRLSPLAKRDAIETIGKEGMKAAPVGDTVTVKSTKADNACVPIHLWNDRALSLFNLNGREREKALASLNTLRDKLLLPLWRRMIGRDFKKWMGEMDISNWWHTPSERHRTLLAGGKALFYASQATWWEWEGGSFPFFWKWPPEFLREIRDGMPPRFTHNPPACMDRQRPNGNPVFAEQERRKVFKVIQRGYLRPVRKGELRSLMHYFSVPKGDNDIRMVYDGSKCKLNAATFAPWFAVPTSSTLERTVTPDTIQGDNDFGDMFLNFQLHEEMQKYTGVDARDLLNDTEARDWMQKFSDQSEDEVMFTWDRPAMGLTSSPYQAVQTVTRAKRLMLGDPASSTNPFRWDKVVINAPGSQDYNPRLPWIFKVRADGLIAADMHTYIDDNRVTANDAEEAWRASSQIAKTCSSLGMQDAARKRRAPSAEPGAWAGTIIRTDGESVEKMVSQERWDKTKDRIQWIQDQLEMAPNKRFPKILHKRLESIRGFLVYVSRTYCEMVPYLKGIHLTLDSWRTGRSGSGWKFADQEAFEEDGCELTNTIDERIQPLELRGMDGVVKPPLFVIAAERLTQDVATLLKLTSTPAPPAVMVRPTETMVGYLVGDASGAGHGTSFLYTGRDTLDLTHGTWGETAANRSSNFRELGNLVRRVEQLLVEELIPRGTELFVFTDNFVTESVFYKGAARSCYLHGLVERLKMLQLHGGLFIHVIWIAGTRMIEQGTDGLSRGDLSTGVLAGKDFLSFVPLNRSALELSPKLEAWIQESLPGRYKWKVLSPAGWYKEGHSDGHFIWSPPPAVADAVLEQLCEAVISRPWNAHVFVCPAHMTYRWRKQLRKVSDLVLTIRVGGALWPHCLHEPLVFGLTCPLLAYSPWRVKKTGRLAEGRDPMPKVWSQDWKIEGNILRELWVREVPNATDLLWGLAQQVLHEEPKRPVPGPPSQGPG
jgi:hypothetical protein